MSIFEYDKVEEEKKLRKAEFETGVNKASNVVKNRHLLKLQPGCSRWVAFLWSR